MKIGDKIVHNGIEAVLVAATEYSCSECVFSNLESGCPKENDDENELLCIVPKEIIFGVFKQVKTEEL
jgi:hypothetical protein